MIPTRGACITEAAGTGLAHHLFSKIFTLKKSPMKNIEHSGFPYHTFVHCKGFAPAAPLRARVSVSVPFSRLLLSKPLPIKGLVVHYTTNNLIGRRLILRHCFSGKEYSNTNPLSGFTLTFAKLSQTLS